MTKKRAFIRILVFMAFLIVPTLLWGLCSIFGLKDKLDFDLGENRTKHTISADTKLSEMPGELELTYNDNVPFRSVLIDFNKKFNSSFEGFYDKSLQPKLLAWINKKDTSNNPDDDSKYILPSETSMEKGSTDHEHDFEVIEKVDPDYQNYGYELRKCKDCGYEQKVYIDKLKDTSLYPLKVVNNTVVQGRFGWKFYADTLIDYSGSNVMNEDECKERADAMQKLKDVCEAQGKELYFIVIPNKNSVYSEYMPTVSEVAEKRRVQCFKEYLSKNTDLDVIYPLNEMLENKPLHQLYLKYDSHWNAYGSVIGANALYTKMGMSTFTFDNLDITETSTTFGDLTILEGTDNNANEPDYDAKIEYKKDITAESNNIGDDRIIESTSNSTNKKKLIMMGDSYRYGFSKFLCKDFSETVLFNRELKDSDIVAKHLKDSNIVVIELVERNFTHVMKDIDYVYGVLTDNK